MTEQNEKGFKKKANQLDNITKPIRNIAWLGALVIGAWVQFLGPGLGYMIRDLSGSNEIETAMQEGFNDIAERLDFIEENMTPPRIINWLNTRSIGTCNEEQCRVMHTFSRTPYGEDCGIPSISIEIRLENGDKFPLFSDFTPIEGNLGNTRVIHDFKIDYEFIYRGKHSYQFTLDYPTCTWEREPLPRFSPWFDLTVN